MSHFSDNAAFYASLQMAGIQLKAVREGQKERQRKEAFAQRERELDLLERLIVVLEAHTHGVSDE